MVDGTGITRVFANFTAAAITGLTITGGFMPPISPLLPLPIGGGGVANIGVLRLQRVAVSGNHADFGAGIFNYPFSFLGHQRQRGQRQQRARGGRHPLRLRRPGREHYYHR